MTLASSAVALGTMKVDGVLSNEGVRRIQMSDSGEVIGLFGPECGVSATRRSAW